MRDVGLLPAGYEVGWTIEAPDGWTLWRVPDTTFVVIACTMATYSKAWEYFHNEFLPDSEYEQAGAVFFGGGSQSFSVGGPGLCLVESVC